MESHSAHVHGDFAAGMRSRPSAHAARGTFASGRTATASPIAGSISGDTVTDCRGIEMSAGLMRSSSKSGDPGPRIGAPSSWRHRRARDGGEPTGTEPRR